jgi:GTP1/Obg family GTP-binding protein
VILTQENLAEAKLQIWAAHFKSIDDSKLIQKWARLNHLTREETIRDINYGSPSFRMSVGASKPAQDPSQKIRYVLKEYNHYASAQKQATLIRTMAKAKNLGQYNQARRELMRLGYTNEELDEIPRPG